ncbi:MAG: HD domain-containing phosphohydrolase [Candidatus Izemoplasma sp.]|nr:HD domain-containing phosphohydrolase [Candidatus Izemoplasma sp.]
MKSIPKWLFNVVIASILLVVRLIELTVLTSPENHLSFFFTLPMIMASIYITKYRGIYGIIGGLLSGTLIYYGLTGVTLLPAVIYASLTVIIYLSLGILIKQNFNKKYFDRTENLYSYIVFTVVAFISAFVGSVLLGTLYLNLYGNLSFQGYVIKLLPAMTVSIVSITLPILLMHVYPIRLTLKRHLVAVIFSMFYLATLLLLFSTVNHYLTDNFFTVIIIVLFSISAYLFNFKVLIAMNASFILVSRMAFYDIVIDTEIHFDLIGIDLILFISCILFIITKKYVHTIHSQKERINQANTKLKDMFTSTIGLMQLTEWIDQDNSKNKVEYLDQVFSIATRLFDRFDAVLLAHKSGNVTRFIDAKGINIAMFKEFPVLSNLFNWQTDEPIVYQKPQENYRFIYKGNYKYLEKFLDNVSLDIRIPIRTGEDRFGALIFLTYKTSDYYVNNQEIKNIQLFQQMVNLVYNVSALNHRTNSLKDDIVLSLIRTLELFDQYTGSHSEQVADIALHIAKYLNLSQEEQTNIYWAGIVHDIGKIGVGFQIVNKKDPLTKEEYEAIKQHPVFGYNILVKSKDLTPIANLVKHHHEWYNGNGYPDGLKQGEIPVGSQILCIADAISAMSTKRPYSRRKTHEEIIAELQLYKDTQFNPKLVDIAIKCIQDGNIKIIIEDAQI